MKSFKAFTGISILLFLVVSAIPAYSAKPWPEGGEKGPDIPGGFSALTKGNALCGDGSDANQKYKAVVEALEALGYTANGKDLRNYVTHAMPITHPKDSDGVPFRTPYKDKAGMAWQNYHSMWDFEKGNYSGALSQTLAMIDKFDSNTSTDAEGNIFGRRISDLDPDAPPSLNDIADTFDDLVTCIQEHLQ